MTSFIIKLCSYIYIWIEYFNTRITKEVRRPLLVPYTIIATLSSVENNCLQLVLSFHCYANGTGDVCRARTSDLPVRNRLLYTTELPGHMKPGKPGLFIDNIHLTTLHNLKCGLVIFRSSTCAAARIDCDLCFGVTSLHYYQPFLSS